MIAAPTASQLIAGELVAGEGQMLPILDPARGQTIAELAEASAQQVAAAVSAARRAFDTGNWSGLTPAVRGDAMIEIARRLRAHAEEIAQLDSLNVGKPITQARNDVQGAADYFDYFGRVIIDLPDEVIENTADQITLVVREPIGVVGAIIPWNFPITLIATTIAAPLVAGNTVVLKPSELTPLSALRFAELAGDVFPPGVLNIVTGTGAEVGKKLASQPGVDRIAFTGSTQTGTVLMQEAAKGFKRVGLELGGKSPTVVFADAPFSAAVRSALSRITLNQGENCAAGSRLLVQQSIYDAFLEAIVQQARTLTIGDPQLEETEIGPMISLAHQAKVEEYLGFAGAEGHTLFTSTVPSKPPLSQGFYVPVTIVESGPGTRVWSDEVFGPLLTVVPFKDEEDAVRLANDSQYGLMSVVWCGDRARGLRFARRVKAGIVRINAGSPPIHGPWGGFKASGIGRSYGRHGIEESTEIKQINIDLRAYD